MSDGKKYGSTLVLSPEERADEAERKLDVLRARMQHYDEIINEFKSIRHQVNNLLEAFSGLNSKQNRLEVDQKENLSDLLNLHMREDQSIKAHDTCINNHTDILHQLEDNLYSYIKSTELGFKQDRQRVTELFNDAMQKYEFEQFQKENTANLAEMKQILQDHQEDIKTLGENGKQYLGRLSDLDKNFRSQNLNSVHSKFEQTLTLHEKEMKDNILNSEAIQTARLLDFKEYLLSEFKKMKEEVLGTPTSLPSIKKEFLDKMESVIIEASNATIKTSNTLKKIDLLERKFEMINLILQKNDIK